MLSISSACGCNIGRVRSNNEDNLFFNGTVLPMINRGLPNPLSFSTQLSSPIHFGVFDGMGGEAQGELASYIAASELRNASDTSSADDMLTVLHQANSQICKEAHHRGCGVIGTTAAILSINSTSVCAVNVGDSKIYRLRNGVMTQVSTDHTDKALLDRCGIQGRKPRLTQHLGIDPSEMIIEPAVWKDTVCTGDCFLICSDGLTDMLSEHEISAILFATQPVDCVDMLINRALQNSGRDNVTTIVVKIV